jgi:hypothetical protein
MTVRHRQRYSLPAHSGLTPAARAATGVRLGTFAHEAAVLWLSKAGGRLDARHAGFELHNSGVDVFGFGSSSAGGNVRAPHSPAARFALQAVDARPAPT